MTLQLLQSIVLWFLSFDKEASADSGCKLFVFVHCLPTALPQSQYHRGNFPAQPARHPAEGLQTGPDLQFETTPVVSW